MRIKKKQNNALIQWINEHDTKKAFIILYIGISLVMSIAVSLFWLLFAVLIHFFFELVAQSTKKKGRKNTLLESLWETKLDFGLVAFALWLSVYLDFIFGVAGLAALRGGAQTAQAGVRFAAWNRIIRAFLLSLDDVGNAIKSIYAGKKAKQQKKITDHADQKTGQQALLPANDPYRHSWSGKWGVVDHIGVWLFLVSLAFVLLAPWLIGMSWPEITAITLKEFHPLPHLL